MYESPTSPTPTPLPVTAVTCLEDRAHVERTTTVEVAAGVQRLLLGPVSALAVDRSLHAELTGAPDAAVVDVRLVRAWTPRSPQPPTDEDSRLRRHAHALEEERRPLEQRRDRLRTRLDVLGKLSADLLRDIGEGAGSGETEAERWERELDRVDAEIDTHDDELRSTEAQSARLAAELKQTWQALDLAEEEPRR